MKRKVLILGFILLFQNSLYAADVYNIQQRHYYQRPHYKNHYFNHPKRVNSLKGGALTGFSPPVIGSYYTLPNNNYIGQKMRSFFNKNFNNHYLNQPYYKPSSNENYINNGKTTLFSTPNPKVYYNNQDEYGLNSDNGFKTETKVTIID